MQFILIAYDSTDSGAPERRLNSRPQHLARIASAKKEGKFLFGGAMLNDNEQMIGSVVLYDVADRAELDDLLKDEPYILNKVWDNIDIKTFRLAKTGLQ